MAPDPKKNRRSSYDLLKKYPLSSWKGLVLILVVTILSTAFNLLQPLPMKVLVDHVFDNKPISDGIAQALAWIPWSAGPGSLLLWVALAGLLIFVINSSLGVVLTFLWIRVGQKMVYDLTCDLFSYVQRCSLLFHNRTSVGDLMSRVTGDSWAIYTVTDTLVFTPIHAVFLVAAMVVVMAQINLEMTLVSLAVAPVMAIVSASMGKRIRNASHKKRESESRIQSHVQQTLSGMTVIQSFAQEERESTRFRDFAREAIGAQKRSSLTGGVFTLLSGGVSSLGTGLVLYVGAHYVISGRLSIGSLLVFIAYLHTLQGELKALIGTYSTLQTAGAGIDRVIEVLNTEQEIIDAPGAREMTSVQGEVRFENVSFGYEKDTPVLKNISFEVVPGQTIAIVGPTGAGKSSLVSLIPRFFDASGGRVLIDGCDVRDIKLESLRSHIAIVLQEPFLFPVTIAENIAYGRPNATCDEIEAAAIAANAHQFIEGLSDGYDTIIGERGSTLSGGERQRLSIARAILKNAPILILDEPTSAVDAQTEELILGALERLTKDRTTFIIAHRLSTVRKSDRIIVIENGGIVETGSRKELLGKKGLYAFLNEIQFGERRSVGKESNSDF